jgi:hypothetical protein
MQTFAKPFLLALLMLMLNAVAHSRLSFAAELTHVLGEVQVEGKPAARGLKLAEGQTVRAGKASAALLALDDGSKVKLNSETELRLDRLRGGTELELKAGAVFSQVEKQPAGKQAAFRIRTKTAVMGVRGTRFYTAAGRDIWMCVNEGRVEVESQGKSLMVQEGEGIFVPAGKPATEPKPYAWTKGLNWNMSPEQGELIDRTKIEYKDLLERNYD